MRKSDMKNVAERRDDEMKVIFSGAISEKGVLKQASEEICARVKSTRPETVLSAAQGK